MFKPNEHNMNFIYIFTQIFAGLINKDGSFNLQLITNIMNDFQIDHNQRPIFWEKSNIVLDNLPKVK